MFRRAPLTLLALFIYQTTATPASETVPEERLNTTLPGERLVSLGRQLDSPLLRIIGQTFLDMYSQQMCQLLLRVPCQEWSQWSNCTTKGNSNVGVRSRTRECGGEAVKCPEYPTKRVDTEEASCEQPCTAECQEWSQWSKCTATRIGALGFRSRTRECGGEAAKCPDYPTKRVDTKEARCEGTCPADYRLTSGGLCLKYLKKYIEHSDAEGLCSKDGGLFANINSREKLQDIVNTIKMHTFIWVDGTRDSNTSPWQYRYGEAPDDMNWGSNDPDNGQSDLCSIYFRSKRYDISCSSTAHTLCEII